MGRYGSFQKSSINNLELIKFICPQNWADGIDLSLECTSIQKNDIFVYSSKKYVTQPQL